MLARSLLKGSNLFSSLTYQARGFAQNVVVPNQVNHYFIRAKLIDSIRLSLRSNSPGSLFPLLDNPYLDSFVVTNAIRSAPSPESALFFIEALKRVPDFSHTQYTLVAMAKILAKSGRSAQLKKLIEDIDGGKFAKVSPFSVLDRLRWYAAAGDLDSVLCVWDDLLAQGKRPCVESYNMVMGLYVRKGKDLEAVQIFRAMMQGGGIPNSRTFTIVIEHLLNSGKVDAGKEVYDILPLMRVKHTLRQYSLMVTAFSNLERFDVVKSVLLEMKLEGVLPPMSLQSSLQCMQEAGVLEDNDEFLREMVPDDRIKKIEDHNDDEDEEDDVQSTTSDIGMVQLKPWLDPSALASALRHWTPDDVSFLEDAKLVWTSRLACKIIRHIRSAKTVWQFFCWVACQPGFTHDVHTYSGAIRKLARHGKVDVVDHLLLKVKNEGIKLGLSTVRQIIDFYGLFKEGDAALRVFDDVNVLCSHFSESDILVLYSSLLRTLVKCGRDSDIIDRVNQMFSNVVFGYWN